MRGPRCRRPITSTPMHFCSNPCHELVLADAPREQALMSALIDVVFGDMGAALTSYFDCHERASKEREAIELVKSVETETEAADAIAETQAASLRAIVADLEKVLDGLRERRRSGQGWNGRRLGRYWRGGVLGRGIACLQPGGRTAGQ